MGDSPRLSGDDGTKDSAAVAISVGAMVPLCIVALVIVNIVIGRVYWPDLSRSGRLITVYRKFWPVFGTSLLELGVGGIVFAWYGLANWTRTERFCWPVAIASVGAAFGGLCIFVIGVLI